MAEITERITSAMLEAERSALVELPSFPVRVKSISYEAESVVSVQLEHVDGEELPPWEPGSHLDLLLPNGFTRQYSIVESAADNSWYRVAVLLDVNGRGGSEYVHMFLRPGQLVNIRSPKNHFKVEPAEQYLFIAGGIGITPIIPMVNAVATSGAQWHLHYGGARRSSMGFVNRLVPLDGHVSLYPSRESGRMSLREILSTCGGGTQVYCCGPEALLSAVLEESQDLGTVSEDQLHFERFKPRVRELPEVESPVTVVAARSGIEVEVSADVSVLEALNRSGIRVPSSCREGICGTCECRVLEGVPDHRDDALTPQQHSAGDTMLVCVSRALTPKLVLDV